MRSASKSFAVPISKFQSEVLRPLAAQRSPDSHIAGGIAINRQGLRFSDGIDIFHEFIERQESAVKADEAALVTAGYTIAWPQTQRTGRHEATIENAGEQMRLGWVTDSAFRFFPMQPDELFGYVLHSVDLATNKASAAAVGKFPGTTPEEMLAEITRHSRFTAGEFEVLATEQPVDVRELHRRIGGMIEAAEDFIAKLPSDAVGVVFLDGDKPVQPDLNALDRYRRNRGAVAAVWPTSPEIVHAKLERCDKPYP